MFFRATNPDMEVKVCGCRLVYEQDFEDLIHSLTACTFEQPHVLSLLHQQAEMYVDEMVDEEKPAEFTFWSQRSNS